MIYLELFLSFLKIGLFSFGGGAGMIALLKEEVSSHGWLSEEMLSNFIGIAESTPGPIAVNMATFVGSSQGGLLGAFCATFGVVLPAFLIILLIAALLKNFLSYKGVKAALGGMNPVVLGLILGTGILMFVRLILPLYRDFTAAQTFDFAALGLTLALVIIYLSYKYFFKKKMSPILLIIISAILGIVVF
jgi:chromate transporter